MDHGPYLRLCLTYHPSEIFPSYPSDGTSWPAIPVKQTWSTSLMPSSIKCWLKCYTYGVYTGYARMLEFITLSEFSYGLTQFWISPIKMQIQTEWCVDFTLQHHFFYIFFKKINCALKMHCDNKWEGCILRENRFQIIDTKFILCTHIEIYSKSNFIWSCFYFLNWNNVKTAQIYAHMHVALT